MTAAEFFAQYPLHSTAWMVGDKIFFPGYEKSARAYATRTGQDCEEVQADQSVPEEPGNIKTKGVKPADKNT